MKNPKPFHKRIALVLLAIFLPSLLPVNLLYASNNGPVAPEATSFEPVDVTDMVNLISGDMSYVLPILNVPSPEGGYPLALSYHAGIAMDQEASWTGLGWNLNPGAINRSVSGVPDDWNKTNVMELLYDAGETLDQYDFSIGGILPNGVTIGMSKSWGQNRAWGGVIGYGGITTSFGSDNFGMSVDAGPLKINMDDINGASANLSMSYGSFGGSVNYNFSNKKASFNGRYGGLGIGSDGVSLNLGTVGVSLNSNGGVGFRAGSSSLSTLNTSTSSTQGDYYTNTSSNGFNIDVGFFWASYQHTRYTYSLFLLNRNNISGTLNLYDTKNENNYIQNNKDYMDVKSYYYGYNIIDASSAQYPKMTDSDVVFPNYDNYSVASQGLSGSFSPKIFEEVLLYGQGSRKKVTDNNPPNFTDSDYLFLTQPASSNDLNFKLNNKIHFYFDNVNSSFLRLKKGEFESLNSSFVINYDLSNPYAGNPTLSTIGSEGNLVNNVVTSTDNTYSSPLSPDGNLKKVGNRKRDGNFIEAFTNNEITQNNTNGYFIEGNNYDRSFYTNLVSEGIGAYRITALDGKVYHYSIPVYNFEEMNKNYSNAQNQDDKFIETIKSKPYATHWLLTAITGPDYVDINNNNIPDESDYGYWVTLDYGKWTDGYGWRSPKVGAKEMDGKYSYFWGRKEIYYLDKIKTRTHSAVFIKSVRNDDKSSTINYGSATNSAPGSTTTLINRSVTQNFKDRIRRDVEQGNYYDDNGAIVNVNTNIQSKHYSYKHVNLPVNYTLKLDKILLLKNSDADSMIKYASGNLAQTNGYTYFDHGFITETPFGTPLNFYRKNPYGVKKSTIHTSGNLYDVYDVKFMLDNFGNDIESKALKVINFNYDYSLGNNLPNASSGRLTLKNVELNGRGNAKVLPPYKFNYTKATTPYNFANSDDWGYVKDNPDAWSLNEIITPTGGKLNFEYESDSFVFEAIRDGNNRKQYNIPFAHQNPPTGPILNYEIIGDIFKLNLNPNNTDISSYNLNNLFITNDIIKMKYVYKEFNPSQPNGPYLFEKYIDYEIISVDDNLKTIEFKILENNDLIFQNDYLNEYNCNVCTSSTSSTYNYQNWCGTYPTSSNYRCKYGIYFDITAPQNLIDFGFNGKKGGGIRVKKISLTDEMNNSFETHYSYVNPKTNNISGITSYEPTDENLFGTNIYYGIEEFPSPEVMYKYVTVSNISNNNLVDKKVYEFNVLERLERDITDNTFNGFQIPDIYSFDRLKYQSSNNYFQKINIYDKLSSLGRIEVIKNYNSENQLLSSTKYNYNEFDENSMENGTIQESFRYYKRGNRFYPKYNQGTYIGPEQSPIYAMYRISKTTLPNILKSITSTSSSYTNTTYYDKYDFLTAQVLETTNVTSDGKIFKTKTIPAYLKYSGMGSKVNDINNANMLSQTAATYSYIQDSGVWKETGVGITTWNNEWVYRDIEGNTSTPTNLKEKIWRKHKTYTWNGVTDSNGIFTNYDSQNGDDGFVWGVGLPQTNSRWKQLSEVTLYDHYSMPLEIQDINANKAATKMDVDNTKIIATGNAAYNEMYYSGAETSFQNQGFWIGQEVRNTNGEITNEKAHTGKFSIKATNTSEFGVYMQQVNQHRAGKYKLSVWVHKDNVAKARIYNTFINGSYNTIGVMEFNGENYTAGEWVLKTHYFDCIANLDNYVYVTSVDNTTVHFDDLMIRPIASSITGYVYNEYDELTEIISNNGLATRFEYDAAGRLVKTYVEILDDPANGVTGGFKLQSENQYHYKNL